jgi:protein-S-isoprenylcysteine O-methyltransferase Ste14
MKTKLSKLVISSGIAISLAFAIYTFFMKEPGNYEKKYPQILFFMAMLIYQLRYFYLINYLKKNKVTFQLIEKLKKPLFLDTLIGLFLFCILPIGLVLLNEHLNSMLDWTDITAFFNYLSGTAITLISEKQRKDWKQKNNNSLYQGGLFKYANHINYFGETLSFPSFCWLASANIFVFLAVVLHQLIDFIFIQIPKQEDYLKRKYPDEYAKTLHRKKLIPMIY